MRATCETCGHRQPPDWQPGDLCTSCGAVVRREQRCYWCVQPTPEGKYCRHCGAGQVPAAQYGAARWLKHVGTDQLTIPKRLAEMEPDQVDHFSRLYQAQGNVVARHVHELEFAEGFLRQRGWAQAWEEEMLPRLPMPEPELAPLRTPPLPGSTEAEKLLAIRETSPLPLARTLASLARLRLLLATGASFEKVGFWLDFQNARDHLRDPDLALQSEAGLTLCHWWLLLDQVSFSTEYQLQAAVYTASKGPLAAEASICLALFDACNEPGPQPVPPEALGNPDPDLAFAAALASQAPDALHAALRVPRRRFAAAFVLTRMGAAFDLPPLLPAFTPKQIGRLLWAISKQQRPRPDLRPLLQQVLDGKQALENHDITPVEDLLALDLRPGDAVRLITQYPEPRFITKVLQAPALPLGEAVDVCRELVAFDLFDPSRLPVLHTILADGTLPVGFVPAVIGLAPANSFRNLQPLVRQQLQQYPVGQLQPLHQLLRGFQTNVAQSALVRNWASDLLVSWYGGDYASGRPALTFTEAAAGAYFVAFREFIEDQVHLLEHPADFQPLESGHRLYHPLQEVRSVQDPALVNTPLAALPPALVGRLRTALVAFVSEPGDHYPREGALHLLHLMRFYAPWQAEAQAALETLRGGCYDYQVQRYLAVPTAHTVIAYNPADNWGIRGWAFAEAQPAPLSLTEIEQVEAILAQRIAFLNADYEKEHAKHPAIPFDRESVLIDLPRYARQYVPFTTPDGEKLVWVQLLRHPPEGWRTQLVWVLDGGNSCIQAVCRIRTGQVLELHLNGSA